MFEKNIRLEFDLELTMNNLNILVKKTFNHQEKILGTGGGHPIRVFLSYFIFIMHFVAKDVHTAM